MCLATTQAPVDVQLQIVATTTTKATANEQKGAPETSEDQARRYFSGPEVITKGCSCQSQVKLSIDFVDFINTIATIWGNEKEKKELEQFNIVCGSGNI